MRIPVGRPFGCALVLAFLATTSGPAARAREHRPCEMIEYCVDVGEAVRDGFDWLPRRHLFDRALFLLAHCPEQLLDTSRLAPELRKRWLEELAEVSFTGDEARRSAIEPFRAALVSDLRRRGDAPPLGRILERLETIRYETLAGETSFDARDPRPDGTGRPSPEEEIPPERRGEGPEGSWRCGAFSTLVLEELIEDWRRRDGAWFFCFSDQFLFHLAACPDEFLRGHERARGRFRDLAGGTR
jgi:hypothetical protein